MNNIKLSKFILLGLCLVLGLSACAKKEGVSNIYTTGGSDNAEPLGSSSNPYPKAAIVCLDLKNYPQDLMYYAKGEKRQGLDQLLLGQAEQIAHDAKSNKRFLMPWQSLTNIPKSKDMFLGQRYLNPKRGYAENMQAYPQARWDQLVANCNQAAYPSKVVRAITVSSTALRMMPTDTPFFLSPNKAGEGFPFDQYQNSMLWVGTPVLALHSSRDGEWTLVTTPAASGWAKTQNLAEVSEEFAAEWSQSKWAAIIKDSVVLEYEKGKADAVSGGKFIAKAHVGTILPLVSTTKQGNLQLKVPVRGADGQVKVRTALLKANQATPKPMPLTPQNVAKVANEMIGQPYGWGGYLENRDCSAMTKSLYAVFGIWLPRNSGAQATWGRVISLKGMSPAQKEATIAKEATPFLSLIWMKGHIGVYVGNHPKTQRPAFFHNVWGIRVKGGTYVMQNANASGGTDEAEFDDEQGANDPESEVNVYNGRVVIGRAVVTSLSPGVELPNIATPYGLLERMERIVILPEAEIKTPLVPKAIKKSKDKGKNKKNAKLANAKGKKAIASKASAKSSKTTKKTVSKKVAAKKK